MTNIYDRITQDMLRRLEAGAGKFEMPWHSKGTKSGLLPVNATTGKIYNGANALQFWCIQKELGYTANVWATYKQWQALGAQVRKGERSAHGIYWKQMAAGQQPEAGQDNSAAGSTRFRLAGFGFNVFNADQVDGWQAEQLPEIDTIDRTNPVASADAVIAGSGATIRHGGAQAYYQRTDDYVQLPDRFRFIGTATSTPTECYYATTLHELTHWTGAAHRLDRTKGKRFGDPAYAFEELVAEIGSAFLCARLGVTNVPRPDHAAYVANWIKALQDDNRAIFNAASLAQKACDYLLNRLAAPAAEPLALAA